MQQTSQAGFVFRTFAERYKGLTLVRVCFLGGPLQARMYSAFAVLRFDLEGRF
jgi:hypothetical protein